MINFGQQEQSFECFESFVFGLLCPLIEIVVLQIGYEACNLMQD